VGNTLCERELPDTTSLSSTTRLSTAIRTRRPLSGISDERPICREFASPYDLGLIVQRSTSLSEFACGPALTGLALALAMFEQTFGHQKLSIGRPDSRNNVADCRPRALRSGDRRRRSVAGNR